MYAAIRIMESAEDAKRQALARGASEYEAEAARSAEIDRGSAHAYEVIGAMTTGAAKAVGTKVAVSTAASAVGVTLLALNPVTIGIAAIVGIFGALLSSDD